MTDPQWEFIQKKFGKLFYTIAQNISGDCSLDVDDVLQEMFLATKDAIWYYEKQDNGANGTFDEFKDTPGFASYLKTVLWHKKGSIGTNIKKTSLVRAQSSRFDHSNKDGDIISKSHLDPAVTKSYDFEFILPESELQQSISVNLSDTDYKVAECIINNPSQAYKKNGTLCLKSISRLTGVNYNEVFCSLERIKEKYEKKFFEGN